jgi:hypothetical protein
MQRGSEKVRAKAVVSGYAICRSALETAKAGIAPGCFGLI